MRWDELTAQRQIDWAGDLHCVIRWWKFGMRWRGVDVAELIARARPRPQAGHVMAHSYGGYTTNLRLSDVLEHPALIAQDADEAPLEADHGGSARLLVPHLYLWKSAKWVNRLELLDGDELGFWERNGYQHRGTRGSRSATASTITWRGRSGAVPVSAAFRSPSRAAL